MTERNPETEAAAERAQLRERILDRSTPEPNTGCWLWSGSGTINGYGQITIGKHKQMAHRLSYEAFVGPVPSGLVLDHICRQRWCVNPEHLEPVTQRVNTLRGKTLPAVNAAKTHCKRGHEFTPENLYASISGKRICKACKRAHKARFHAANTNKSSEYSARYRANRARGRAA